MPFQRTQQSVRTVSIGSRIDDVNPDDTLALAFGTSCLLTPFPTLSEAIEAEMVDDVAEWLHAYRLDGRTHGTA